MARIIDGEKLNIIGENEGFITPLKGMKALYLNLCIGLFIEKKLTLSTKTKELFLLRNLPVNIYIMSHQFHKWYGYKMKLPGYDTDTQEKFKKLFRTLDNNAFKALSIKELVFIKEAVARDKESVDLVLEISKEYEGAKNALNKMKTQKGASI